MRTILFRPDDTPPAGGADPGAGADDGRPDWLPDKFKSPEDLARSYSEAERELGRLRSETERQQREFSEALAAIGENQPPQQTWNPTQDPTIAAYNRALEEGDGAAALAISLQVQQAAMQQQFEQFAERFAPQMQQASAADREMALRLAEQQVSAGFGERWNEEIAPKLSERLAARPDLLPTTPSVEGYAAALREQANLVEAERIVAQNRAAEAERAAKLAAQTLSNDSARIPTDTDEKKAQWDAIKKAQIGGYERLVGG